MNKIGILYGYWCTEWDVDYMPYLERSSNSASTRWKSIHSVSRK
jgi:hypothetical protein